ncbi:BgTH12-06457 [Blumeria graminis f. sp. triticale]|jgi:hypothetical protein
MYYI